MRDIKFRAWDKNILKWYYDNEGLRVCNNVIFYKGTTEVWKISNTDCNYCQSTGLKDRNGKDIYEGDIYHMGDVNIKCVVIWRNCSLTGKQLTNESLAGLDYWIDDIEIIGNIYENPELNQLKKTK